MLQALGAISDLEVDTSGPERERARADKSGWKSAGEPLAVVYPRTVPAVQECLRVAHREGVPVVPRGGGSGLSGGAIGGPGELVISLEKLDAIVEISPEDRLARVQAGVLNSDLDHAAREHGLWFAPDPASRQWSTIGGNIATNAGGLLCAKYGVTRESVLELSVVLVDGTLLRIGHRSVKGVTGFDLVGLFVGSEGLLGVIVEATVKLLPVSPHPPWTLAARFGDISAAASACQAITLGGETPAVLELIDAHCLRHIHRFHHMPPPESGEVLVIAQADGADAPECVTRLADICSQAGGQVEVSEDPETSERLFSLRRSMHPAMEAVGHVLIEDVSVPRSQMRAMFEQIRQLEDKWNIEIPTVAHAGDGNLHPNFIVEQDSIPDTVWQAADDLFRAAIALGGTLTGEHGVGLLKRRWLPDELGADQLALQQQIKTVFDPKGLLNPGKVFADATVDR